MKNCGNCKLGRKHGKLIYCTYYGMPISLSYSRCDVHKPNIVEEEPRMKIMEVEYGTGNGGKDQEGSNPGSHEDHPQGNGGA